MNERERIAVAKGIGENVNNKISNLFGRSFLSIFALSFWNVFDLPNGDSYL